MTSLKIKKKAHLIESGSTNEYLQIKYVYGLDNEKKQTCKFITSTTFAYLAGCNILTIDIETLKQKIFYFKCRGRIEAFEITSDQKYALLVDVDFRSSILNIIDLNELKNSDSKNINPKKSTEIENEIVKSISISCNNELIACHTYQPNNNLIIFSFHLEILSKIKTFCTSIEKERLDLNLSNQHDKINISFFPYDNKRLLIIGSKLIKIYIYTKKGIKLIFNIECDYSLQNYDWLSKNELVCNDKLGNLYLIEPKQATIREIFLDNKNLNDLRNESLLGLNEKDELLILNTKLRKEFNDSIAYTHLESDHEINTFNSIENAICLNNKGIFISYSNEEKCYFYEKNFENNKINFIHKSTISLKIKNLKENKKQQTNDNFLNNEYIFNLILNADKTYLVAITNKKSIYYLDLNDQAFTNRNNTEFQLLLESYHYESITGVDVCVRKPLVATCSLDGWLMLWNFNTNSLELKQNFDENLLSVAFHPSGHYIILTSTNSLKYISIYLNKFHIQNILNVRSRSNCIFAHGGHIFSFVHGTVVQVYSSSRFKELGSIKTQEMGKIKQLVFSRDDHYLISCSMAGIIKIWNVKSLEIVSQIIVKGLSFIGIDLHPNYEWLFAISTEKSMRQFQLQVSRDFKSIIKSNENEETKLLKKVKFKEDENITCIKINNCGKMLCIGTSKGYIRVFNVASGEYKEFKGHSSSINKISITYNDDYLISCSDDGTVIYWQINHVFRDLFNQMVQSNDECLIFKEDFDKKLNLILNDEEKLNDLKDEIDFKLRMKDLKFKTKQRELLQRFNRQLQLFENKINECSENELSIEADFNSKYNCFMNDYFKQYESVLQNYNMILLKEKIVGENLSKNIENIKNEIDENQKTLNDLTNSTQKKELTSNELKINENNEEKNDILKIFNKNIDFLLDYSYDYEEYIRNEIIKLDTEFNRFLNNFFEKCTHKKHEINEMRILLNRLRLKFRNRCEKDDKISGENKLNETIRTKKLRVHKTKSDLAINEDYSEANKQSIVKSLELELSQLEHQYSLLNEQLDHINNNLISNMKIENSKLNNDLNGILKEVKEKKIELLNLKLTN